MTDIQTLSDHVAAALGDAVTGRAIAYGELTIVVEADRIVEVLTGLRDDPACRFISFIDLCGADYPGREQRFDVVYHLLSPRHNTRIRVKVTTDETTPVPSVIPVFPCANWFERETYDLYGILFTGHPDLRPHSHRLRLRRPPAAQGLPADGLRRGPLRRRAEARRLRAREAAAGVPELRLPVALGRDGLHPARGREGGVAAWRLGREGELSHGTQ